MEQYSYVKGDRDVKILNFINTAINTLPQDPIRENYVRQVQGCFSLVNTTPVKNPQLVHYSKEALELLDINPMEIDKIDLVQYFSGNKILPGSQPAAHCYCGHQFGYFSGQLGDGRAHYLGEIINSKGQKFELQLKGSGKNPYSREGDGRAVLRSSIREFLCSEVMYHLNIPTTRAATIITSDTYVDRDIKYNGQITRERATIILRIAPTFIRFGSFQIADPIDPVTGEKGPSFGNLEIIKQLIYYVIKHHYPHILNKYSSIENRVIAFVEELTYKTAKLVGLWQSYGFTHGVINTDNMSAIGLTIDYGPFGFLDSYDPNFVPNASDKQGRYKFKDQPAICKWNLKMLFQSISQSFPYIKHKFDEILEKFYPLYHRLYLDQMRKKLGFFKNMKDDEQIIMSLLNTMYATSSDFTNVFRCLSELKFNEGIDKQTTLNYILKQTRAKIRTGNGPTMCDAANRNLWIEWLELYKNRLIKEFEGINDLDRLLTVRINMMNNINPKYILRNHLAQKAIKMAEQGDYTEIKRLLDVLRDPFDRLGKYHNMGYDEGPSGESHLVLSCSS